MSLARRSGVLVGAVAWPFALVAAVCVAQALLLAAWAWPAPLQDLPNHLARAVAIADLAFGGGARFGADYEFHWTFSPYVLPDALAALGVVTLGAEATGRVLAGAAAVAVPLAAAWCARALGASRQAAALAGLVSAVLALDYTLVAGYLAFKYSAAASLVAAGAMARALDSPSAGRFAMLAVAAVTTYLAHLSGYVMLAAAAVALAAADVLIRRRLSAAAIASLAVVGALGVIHLLLSSAGADAAYRYGTLPEKLHGALHSLQAGNSAAERAIDLGVVALLVACPLVLLRGDVAARRLPLLVAAALVAYALLPQSQPGVTYDTDLRALPQLFGFAAISVAMAVEARPRLLAATTLVVAMLAVAQILVTGGALRAEARHVAALREALAPLPPDARVFPVVSTGLDARLNPLRHAAAYALVDRGVFVPYVFAGFEGGHLGHFRLRPDAVPPVGHRWYAQPGAVMDAAALRGGYDHVTVTLPWDARRLGLCLEPIAANAVAATYRIVATRGADGRCAEPARDDITP